MSNITAKATCQMESFAFSGLERHSSVAVGAMSCAYRLLTAEHVTHKHDENQQVLS